MTAYIVTPLPQITVYGLYQSWHTRGYNQSDLHRVFDTEADAKALGVELQKVSDQGHPHCRHWYYVAPIKCVARLWVVMYQECYEGAIVVGICRSREDAEALKAKVIEDPEKYIGNQIDPDEVYIEEDVLR